jgi:hypothetical protein
MAQRLIVEGDNDMHALTNLFKKRGLKNPLGYEVESKFKEFIKKGDGVEGALKILKASLNETNLTNIGIVIDADEIGAEGRWQSIRNILAEKYKLETLDAAEAQTGPKFISENDMPFIGIWIMPDNRSAGFLEHFLSRLIPDDQLVWQHAISTVDALYSQSFNMLTNAKKAKAALHTWLAWQEEPGKPFGIALKAGYFDHQALAADHFVDWIEQTFQFAT